MLRISGKSFREKALGEPGSKPRVNSKVKGNRNEVEVAKALSKWTGVPFRRVPASGAIHVPLDWLAGDVFCAVKNFDFPFSVETKHYKRVTPGLRKKWWDQACTDAARISKIPMLIYRENGMPANEWFIRVGKMQVYTLKSTDLFNIKYTEFVKTIS